MKKKVEDMILETVLKKHLHLSALRKGLCDKSTLSKYLNRKRRIDRLLLTVFLQRVGKSANQFSVLLTEEEYVYFEWRQKVCAAHKDKDWVQIEQLLQEDMAKDRSCNEILQAQFQEMLQAIVAEKVYQHREEAVCLLGRAIERTVPGFQKGLKADTLLSTLEISGILLWQSLQPNKQVAFQLLKELMQYIERWVQDVQEHTRIYPLVAVQYLKLLQERGQYSACLVIAEQVLEIMTTTGYVSCMEQVLESYVEAAGKRGIEQDARKRQKQLEAWRELMRDINPNAVEPDGEMFLLDVWQEIELVNEAIKISRMELGYSQERLSEDICSPETMSRIETGKQAPHNRNYKALAKKLSLPEEWYFANIDTDDFAVLELQSWLELYVMNQEWEKAEETLEKLQAGLDMAESKNKQYVATLQYELDVAMKRIPVEDRMGQLIGILQLTMPNVENGSWEETRFWKHYFRSREMSVLIQVADVLFVTERKEEEARLLENILDYYRKSKVSYDYHYRIVMLAVARLTSVYSDLGDYERAMEYIEEGIRLSFACGNYKFLSRLVNNKADTLEQLGEKETSLRYYRLAYYASDLMKICSADIPKRSYERLLGQKIEWY